MKTAYRTIIAVLVTFWTGFCCAEEWRVVPRTIVALYDGGLSTEIRYFDIHQFCAMPLEYLGAKVEYYDMTKPLPDIKNDPDVIGVLVGDFHTLDKDAAKNYFHWAIETLDAGKKFVVMGISSGVFYDEIENEFWRRLGLRAKQEWIQEVYDIEFIYKDPFLIDYERDYSKMMPSYRVMNVISHDVKKYLTIKRRGRPETESCLIAIGPNGGYVAEGYGFYSVSEGDNWFRSWYINPFIFFNKAFGLEGLPKADTTTLAGRRIFYSQIDGDGWNNRTLIMGMRSQNLLSSEVIYEEILKNWPTLPFTVGGIAGDLDPAWVGFDKSQEVAKNIYNLSNVEASSHTYSHPFDWKFFENYTPEKEEPYLPLYDFGNWEEHGVYFKLKEVFNLESPDAKKLENSPFVYGRDKDLKRGYSIPRAYANEIFSIDKEITGSIREVNRYTKKEKPVTVIQWSGDCEPFEKALELAYQAKVGNINGGDTRYDSKYPSVSYIAPISRTVGAYRQIYSSMANENLYTDLWTNKFYNFNQVIYTWKNTGTPLRLKPINHYFHMYSGEKRPSLNALMENITFAEDQEIIPIRTSRFINLITNFYTTKIYQSGQDKWKVTDRGELQTLRIDHALFKGVDFSLSQGVVGQRHIHGSLYVYFDQAKNETVVVLKDIEQIDREPIEKLPYLIGSRWRIWDVFIKGSGEWTFKMKGFGDLQMIWAVPDEGSYVVEMGTKGDKVERHIVSKNNLLEVTIPYSKNELTEISIKKK